MLPTYLRDSPDETSSLEVETLVQSSYSYPSAPSFSVVTFYYELKLHTESQAGE